MFQLLGLVIDDDNGRFLAGGIPDRELNFVTGQVVFALYDPANTFGDARPFADRQHFVFLGWIIQIEYRD